MLPTIKTGSTTPIETVWKRLFSYTERAKWVMKQAPRKLKESKERMESLNSWITSRPGNTDIETSSSSEDSEGGKTATSQEVVVSESAGEKTPGNSFF